MAAEMNSPMLGNSKNEIAFIDTSVSGYETLLAGVREGVQVVHIDSTHDGLVQIAAALEGRSGIDALHILSHGSAGSLALGSGIVDMSSLDSHSAELAAIRSALGEQGDILLYGCDVAAGSSGAAFTSRLAELTGADVAASEDLTGSALLGGDWVLEQQHGAIETANALSAVDAFSGVLAVPPADENFDGDDEGAGFTAPTRELDGFTYSYLDGDGMDIDNAFSWINDPTIFFYSGVITGNAMIFMPDGDVEVIPRSGTAPRTVEIRSTDYSSFSLQSLRLESAGGTAATIYEIKGYYQGMLVQTATIDLTSSSSSASLTYAKDGAGPGGDISFTGSGWANIDSITFRATNNEGIGLAVDDINIEEAVPFPTIANAAYDASTGILSVTGADLINGDVIDTSKLTLTGQNGGTYTLTSGTATASSTTAFSITLNAADQLYVNGLLNKNGASPVTGSAYNLSAASGWNTSSFAPADATGNGVTVSNVQAPSISSATYNATTNVLMVTGSNLVHVAGADITVSKLTLTGEGGVTYTLTGTGVEAEANASSFTVTLSGADQAAVELMFNKNGTSSTSGTTYNLAAGDDWNSVITGGNTAVNSAAVTVSNVAVPAISAATYDGASGTLVVTGTGFTKLSGAANDILTNKLTITGEGGATYTLTGSSVEITSGTGFTIALDSTDQAGINALLNKAGTSSTGGAIYNLAAANGWAAGADAAVTTTDSTGNGITVSNPVDVTAPTVASVSVPGNDTYSVGEHLDFTVTFSESVTLTGSGSTLGLTIGSTAQSAAFLSSSGNTVTYRYTVQAGDADANGISVGSLLLGGHTIRDAAGNNAVLTLNSVGATGSVLVDGVAPAVTGTITGPANDTYAVGETLEFTVTFDENVTLSGGPSTLGLTVGSTARSAAVTASTVNSITYSYTVQNGDSDSNGIAVTGISLNGGAIRDGAGNDANVTLTNNLPSLTGVLVDGVAPSVSGNISVPGNGSYRTGDVLHFTVTFDENVTLAGSGSTLGLTIGSTARAAAFESSTANSITYAYTVQAGETDANGITVGAITPNSHTIKDAAGNDAVLTLTSHVPSTAGILVDTTAPQVTSVSVPSNATYVFGQNLDFTVTFDENVTVGADDSTLGLTIGSTARNAVWLSTSGNTVIYRYTVQAGDVDANGITVGSLTLNGDTIGDAAGNNAVLTLNNVGATSGVLVDATVPTVTGTVTAPGDNTYVVGQTLDFTVTFNENVTRSGTPSTLGLTVGSTARNAVITSTTANSITYSYTVQNGDNDTDGIAVTGIALNGGTIRDGAGNDANLTLTNNLPSLTGVLVDGGPPAVSGVTVPANDSYHAGEVLRFTVTFDENVTLTGAGSTLGLTIGSSSVNAAFESSTANSITYAYTVLAGDTDANGITVGAITLNGHTIKDAAGNDAVLTLGSVPSTAGILVDTTAPSVASVTVPSNGSYVAGGNLDFTVTFDENVTVAASGSTLGLTIGSTARSAELLSSSGNTAVYRYTVQAGDVDADGITVGSLALNGGTIKDAADNDAVLTLNSVGSTASVLVDGTVPAVTGTIAAPANDSYVVGDTLSFTVTFDENVVVTGTDSALALTIGSTARSAQFASSTANSITYTYTVQAGDNDADGIAVGAISLGTTTVKDAAGNNASLALAGHVPALTGVLVDTAGPALLTATVNGATMVLTYSDASLLDAANVPATSTFGVLVAGSPVLVSGVVVNAAAHTVTLTLASPVSNGQAVSVAYSDPTTGNDVNAIQDAAGNDAASLASTAVVNNTPSPDTPPATGTVDGVPVQTGTITNPDGSTGQVITVPVVTPSRVEQVGNNTVADIPLVKDAGGTSLLAVQVPVGVGLQATGSGEAKPAGNSLTDLIREIQAHTTAGSQDQNQLTGGGSGFLGGLSNDTPLLVQTIVVTGNGGSSAAPLGIVGQPQGTGTVQTALVIDARSLPNGAALELQNVEFAAVIGAATVTGGAGSQHVWGDGASQNIFLGADDDVLHGGAGNDIVGSAGGNDEIYGDEGNDLVFGGEGNDRLDGGTGRDIARFSGRSDGYSLRVVDGKLVMAAQAGSDGTDTVVAVETLRFTGGQSSADDAVLARLYEGLLHRSGSAAEVAYWQDVHSRGVSMHDVAAAIVGSAESGQLGNPGGTSSHSGFVAGLYQNVLGRTASAEESAYWTGLLDSGVDRATVALGFVNSAEKLSSSLDVDFNHSDVAVLLRMYHAMFGRAPDEAGLNYWLGVHEQGASLGAIADAFTLSAEAQGLLQQGDNAAFIDQLYQTALDRAPSAAEKALLLEQLQQGVFDRGQALLNVAESGESIAIVGSVNTSLSVL